MTFKLGDAAVFFTGDTKDLDAAKRHAEGQLKGYGATAERELSRAEGATRRVGTTFSQMAGQLAAGSGVAGRGLASLATSAVGLGVVGVTLAAVTASALGAAAAVRKLSDGVKDWVSAVIEIQTPLEDVNAQLLALTKNEDQAAAILATVRKEADTTPFAFEELAKATAGLIPAARQAEEPLMDLVKTAEILAASNPAQGLEGAAFALREAVSGDFTSVIERFNLPRSYINQLKEEGVPALEIVRQAMERLGYDMDLVAQKASTFKGKWSTLQDTIQSLKITATTAAFGALKNGLAEVQKILDEHRETLQLWAELVNRVSGWIMEKLVGAVVYLARAAAELAQRWMDRLLDMDQSTARSVGYIAGLLYRLAEEAVQWGMGIVEAMAIGVMAAIGSVVEALKMLGQVIAYWLAPGSPPRLLPDLEVWGEAAAQAWLDGFAGADTSVLLELRRQIEGELDAINRKLAQVERRQSERLDLQRLAELDAILKDPRATQEQKERAQLEREQILLLMKKRQLERALGVLPAPEIQRPQVERAEPSERLKKLDEVADKLKDDLGDLKLKMGEIGQVDLSALTAMLDEVKLGFEEGYAAADDFLKPLEAIREFLFGAPAKAAAEQKTMGGRTVLTERAKAPTQGLIDRIASGDDLAEAFRKAFADNPELIQIIVTSMENLGRRGRAALIGSLLSLPPEEWDTIGRYGGDIGSAIVAGILLKFGISPDAVYNYTRAFAQVVLAQLKLAFGIRSPSTETMAIGESLVEGLILGIQNRMLEVLTPWTTLLSTLYEAAFGPAGWVPQILEGFFGKKGFLASLSTGLEDGWTSIRDTAARLWGEIRDAIKSPLNDIVRMVNKAIAGFNAISEKLGLPTIPEIAELAKGTLDFGGGLAWVGEKGRELTALPPHTAVFPHDLSEMLAKLLRGGGGVTVSLPVQALYVRNDEDVYRLAYEIANEMQRRMRR